MVLKGQCTTCMPIYDVPGAYLFIYLFLCLPVPYLVGLHHVWCWYLTYIVGAFASLEHCDKYHRVETSNSVYKCSSVKYVTHTTPSVNTIHLPLN